MKSSPFRPNKSTNNPKKQQQSISQFFSPKSAVQTNGSSASAEKEQNSSLFIGTENEKIDQANETQNNGGRKRLHDIDDNENNENRPPRLKKHKSHEIEGERSPFYTNGNGVVPERSSILDEDDQIGVNQSNGARNANKSLSTITNGPNKQQLPSRTSKFIFSSSPLHPQPPSIQDEIEESSELRQEKEQLHRQFVKKLGRPDSIAEIKRRNHFIAEESQTGEPGAEKDNEDEEDDAEVKEAASKSRAGGGKKGGNKLTPMERQILDIKAEHGDTLLIVEVGYKFRFFGEDARIAAKELGIVCIPGKYRYDEHPSEAHIERFASASIPVHRLHVHVKRLVAAGHKVGVVRQLETAALKAVGDNRNAPFVRKLTNVYTKGTYIDDAESSEDKPVGLSEAKASSGHLLCLTETNAKGWGNDEKVNVGILTVQPATGDIIYDDFEDSFMRSEIETRLLHIAPCEFLLVGDLSKATERLIQHLSGTKANVFGDKARVQRIDKPKTMAATSYNKVANFYADKLRYAEPEMEESVSYILDKAHKLSEQVTICLAAMIEHLTEYGLEHVFDLTKNFQPFSAQSHMLLNGNTLSSLEIYKNQTDHNEKGTLFWSMNKTKTRFGERLMKKWVGRPLLSKSKLEERIQAVEELKDPKRSAETEKLARVLSGVKVDLEKTLIRIYYKRCTRPELLNALQCLQRVFNEYAHAKDSESARFDSATLQDAVITLPHIGEYVIACLDKINPQAAKADDKYSFFREEHETELVTEHKLGIASVESDLREHLKDAAEKLRRRKVEYVTVAGIEYLIEVENNQLKNVPASWAKISGTKKVSRFHTSEVIKLIRARDQHKEALAAACDTVFVDLLGEIGSRHQEFRDCIQSLATLDCILSLAEVAKLPGYVKPEFVDGTEIKVIQGRHPMVEQLLLDTYVPNDVELSSTGTRAMLITGPNMGGKSSYVRQVALISIMAQIGSYVPADSARLGLLDAVYTRMGASDNIMAGESTFMVELSETADILKQATPRSLVILDELGRGTSTHDGVAIAEAVLDYIVREKRCLTMFITHYQNMARMAASYDEGVLRNVHMRFTETGQDGQDITFLYTVGDGVAYRSYGLNVARLANIPEQLLNVATIQSKELERRIKRKKISSVARQMKRIVENKDDGPLDQLIAGIALL